jgi:hypothetical protein
VSNSGEGRVLARANKPGSGVFGHSERPILNAVFTVGQLAVGPKHAVLCADDKVRCRVLSLYLWTNTKQTTAIGRQALGSSRSPH